MVLSTDTPLFPWQTAHCFEISSPFFESGAAIEALPIDAIAVAIMNILARMTMNSSVAELDDVLIDLTQLFLAPWSIH